MTPVKKMRIKFESQTPSKRKRGRLDPTPFHSTFAAIYFFSIFFSVLAPFTSMSVAIIV